jgi:hypothetical protein
VKQAYARTCLRAVALAASLFAGAPAASAGGSAGPDGAGGPAAPRVRGGDVLAIEVLREAIQRSPTVARLVAELDGTDLVVVVVTGRLPDHLTGQVRIAAATPPARYVRLTLRIPGSNASLMKTLGHELCHAVEIARMPDVRDGESLAASYRKVGIAGERDGYFETEAAIATGLLVARELALAR